MDNTWATPLFLRPLDVGVDISIQASTKYPAGHSDILMGSVSANEAPWPAVKEAEGALGVCGTPEESYQVLRGMRTMGVRVERHQASAVAVARWLAGRPEVVRVLHPALEDFPGHEVWKRDVGGSSGVFSFVLAAPDGDHNGRAFAFLNALSPFRLGYSWGGYSSLALRVDLSDRTIAKAPEGGPLIRLKVGLEDVEDLVVDLERGFAATAT